MMPINILILEDEPLWAWEMEKMLEELEGYVVVATCRDVETAIGVLENTVVDLLLVDIRLKGEMNGLDFAKHIMDKGLPIVFMTQHEDEGIYQESLKLPNHAFLIKPFHKFTLDWAMRSLLASLMPQTKAEPLIYIKVGNKREIIAPESILWIEAKRNYCDIKTTHNIYTVKRSLRLLYQQLPPHIFIYIHKSFVVRLSLITRIDIKKKIVILENTNLPLGRNYIKSLKEYLHPLG